MRRIVRSRTYVAQLKTFIREGAETFGAAVAAANAFSHRSDHRAPSHPLSEKTLHDRLSLYVYPVRRTPFVLIYDFDEAELRVHFIVHGRADRTRIDPTSAEW